MGKQHFTVFGKIARGDVDRELLYGIETAESSSSIVLVQIAVVEFPQHRIQSLPGKKGVHQVTLGGRVDNYNILAQGVQ